MDLLSGTSMPEWKNTDSEASERDKKKRNAQMIGLSVLAVMAVAAAVFSCVSLYLEFGVTLALVPAVGFAFAAVYITCDIFKRADLYTRISNFFNRVDSSKN